MARCSRPCRWGPCLLQSCCGAALGCGACISLLQIAKHHVAQHSAFSSRDTGCARARACVCMYVPVVLSAEMKGFSAISGTSSTTTYGEMQFFWSWPQCAIGAPVS